MSELTSIFVHSVRRLLKSRTLTMIAVLTLALGVGVNTTVFSVINSFLLRPLPVQDPDGLVVMGQQLRDSTFFPSFSYLDYVDYRDQAAFTVDLAAYQFTLVGLSANDKAQRTPVTYVSGNYFSTMGVRPYLGRLILATEGQTPGADAVAVLGYSCWKTRFNRDQNVIGRSVLVNESPVTVVGVTPEGFHGAYSLVDSDVLYSFEHGRSPKGGGSIMDLEGRPRFVGDRQVEAGRDGERSAGLAKCSRGPAGAGTSRHERRNKHPVVS